MSTIPLSAIDSDPATEAERVERYNNVAPSTEKAEANSKLDKFVSGVVERLHPEEDSDAPRAKRKSLDENIAEGLDRHFSKVADEDSFKASREARDELQGRYGEHGDLSKTLDQYIGWAKKFRADPRQAGLEFAASYANASPYALKEHKAKPKVEAEIIDGKRYSGKVLDSIIEDAANRASSEKQDFTATASQRKALKELFPGKSFDEAMATIVKIDSDAYRDPAGTAATIAASFGMNWLPGQSDPTAERHAAESQVAHAAQVLPGFEVGSSRVDLQACKLEYSIVSPK